MFMIRVVYGDIMGAWRAAGHIAPVRTISNSPAADRGLGLRPSIVSHEGIVSTMTETQESRLLRTTNPVVNVTAAPMLQTIIKRGQDRSPCQLFGMVDRIAPPRRRISATASPDTRIILICPEVTQRPPSGACYVDPGVGGLLNGARQQGRYSR